MNKIFHLCIPTTLPKTTNSQHFVGPQSSSNSVHTYNVPNSETSYKSSDTSLTSARDFYESASNYSIADLLGLPPTSNYMNTFFSLINKPKGIRT